MLISVQVAHRCFEDPARRAHWPRHRIDMTDTMLAIARKKLPSSLPILDTPPPSRVSQRDGGCDTGDRRRHRSDHLQLCHQPGAG